MKSFLTIVKRHFESLSRKSRYILVLTLASFLILLFGSLFRPQPQPTDIPPSENDIARLTRLTHRRSLEDTASFFAEIADEAARSIVHIPTTGASGVVWENRTIATARVEPRVPNPVAIQITNSEILTTEAAWTPYLPVAGAPLPADSSLYPAQRSESRSRPGDWVVAVWRTAEGRVFASGTFEEAAPVSCGELASREVLSTIVLTRSMAGGALFTLDGNLLGLVLPCSDRYAAIVPDMVDVMLREAASFSGRLLARYGIGVRSIDEGEAKLLKGSAGALVLEVWIDHAGDNSGLRPGDIIVSLNGEAVTDAEGLEPLASADAPNSPVLSVLRNGAKLDITLGREHDADAVQRAETAGLVWDGGAQGFLIDSVLPNSRAANGGIKAGDRLLRIGFAEPRNLQQVQRLLDAENPPPTFVEIERDGRRLETLLGQAEP